MSAEDLAHRLERVDLGERRGLVALVERAQVGGELLLLLAREADAERVEPPRQLLDPARRDVEEERRSAGRGRSSSRRPTRPKSTSPIARPPSRTSMFAGCGSPWKIPWRKIIAIHVSATSRASSARSSWARPSSPTSASVTPSRCSSVSTRPGG